MQEHDILIGKTAEGDYLRFGGGEHAVLHARSGAGKSVGFSIPNAFAWKGSLVCLDIKRELFNIRGTQGVPVRSCCRGWPLPPVEPVLAGGPAEPRAI